MGGLYNSNSTTMLLSSLICRVCKQSLSSDKFYYRKDTRKYRTECKDCLLKKQRDKYAPIPTKYATEEDKIQAARDRAKQWYKDNKEKAKKRISAWQKSERGKRMRTKAREKHKRLHKDYWRAKIRADRSTRRARELGAGPLITSSVLLIEEENLLKYGVFTCEYCQQEIKETYHLDHKLPLSRGGTNITENLCISCPTCNLEKGNKTYDEYKQ